MINGSEEEILIKCMNEVEMETFMIQNKINSIMRTSREIVHKNIKEISKKSKPLWVESKEGWAEVTCVDFFGISRVYHVNGAITRDGVIDRYNSILMGDVNKNINGIEKIEYVGGNVTDLKSEKDKEMTEYKFVRENFETKKTVFAIKQPGKLEKEIEINTPFFEVETHREKTNKGHELM